MGHIIGADGVQIDPTKIQAVQNWPSPIDQKQLRGFLSLSSYYRKFIKNYGLISRLLIDLLKKNTPYIWTPKLHASFDTLKKALVEAPVLALPNFKKQLVLETDASDKGIGVVLMQDNHPIAYLSKALGRKRKQCQLMKRSVWHY